MQKHFGDVTNFTCLCRGGASTPADSAAREVARQAAMAANEGRLKVPRRPPWNSSTTPEALDLRERESFLVWRRDLASLEEMDGVFTITPFEKNLEVWRQLWRVLERSDLVGHTP